MLLGATLLPVADVLSSVSSEGVDHILATESLSLHQIVMIINMKRERVMGVTFIFLNSNLEK